MGRQITMYDVFSSIKRGRGPFGLSGLGSGPADASVLSPNGLAELNANLIAQQVTMRTGIATTVDDIYGRLIAARYWAEDLAPANARDAASTTLLLALVNAGTPTEALESLRPLIEPLYRDYGPSVANDKIGRAFAALAQSGVGDALAAAALDLGEALWSSGIVTRLTNAVSSILGSAAWLSALASSIGEVVGTVAKMLPIMGALFKFELSLQGIIPEAMWGPQGGVTLKAAMPEWANYPPRLYCRLANEGGNDVVGSWDKWTGSWSPFFYENWIRMGDMGSISPTVRALDIHQYENISAREHFPRWRDIFTSDAAIDFARTNRSGYPLVPGLDASKVLGCHQVGYDVRVAKIYPYRWSQNRAAFRAAIIGSCFINGTVCCIQGLGAWMSGCASATSWGSADADEDTTDCYEDSDTEFYMLGSPFGQYVGRASPRADFYQNKWWSAWGGNHGWEQTVYLMPPSTVARIQASITPTIASSTSSLRGLYAAFLRNRDNWIPIRNLLGGHPELPRAGTAGIPEASRFTPVPRISVMQPTVTRATPPPTVTRATPPPKGTKWTTGETVAAVAAGAAALGLLGWGAWAAFK